MLVQVVKSKIHRVKVTGADLNYIGSITIDEDLMDAANIIEGERVQIVNNNNGILITPKNSQELAKSMRMMDEKLHKKLSLGAINSFKNFEEKSVYQKIIKIINN